MVSVDEYISLLEKKNEIEGKLNKIKAAFLEEAEERLDSKKNKSVIFKGKKGKIRVTLSQSVKPEAPELLKAFFKEGYADFMKEEKVIKTTAEADRILIALFEGGYSDESMDSVLKEMNIPEKQKAVLKRKFKGTNFVKDAEMLSDLCGFSEDDSNYWAYMLTEAIMGEKIRAFLNVSGLTLKEAENIVKAGIDVNEKSNFSADIS